ncbi:AAA family ATPase [Amycolatopsis sp. NPDC004079]|uniref:AAA family ATPase n=1 Tax=Amycolatopsis sp. NPDC004079 TaxID=3154549 RepID=UPI00339E3866
MPAAQTLAGKGSLADGEIGGGSKPRLHVMISARGSGTSTWCADHADVLGEVLSVDAACATIGAGDHDSGVADDVLDLVERSAAVLLAAGRDVTIDATGCRAEDRARWLALADAHDVVPVAILLRCELTTGLWRNRRRQRRARVAAVVRTWWAVRTLTPQRLEGEGFAEVWDCYTDWRMSPAASWATRVLVAVLLAATAFDACRPAAPAMREPVPAQPVAPAPPVQEVAESPRPAIAGPWVVADVVALPCCDTAGRPLDPQPRALRCLPEADYRTRPARPRYWTVPLKGSAPIIAEDRAAYPPGTPCPYDR